MLLRFLRCITTQSHRLLTVSNRRRKHGILQTKSLHQALSFASMKASCSQLLSPFQQPQTSNMGLRHLYHLLTSSKRKPKQPPRSEEAEASSSDPRAWHSDYLVIDTGQQEITPPPATDENPPNHKQLPSDISLGKQPETASTLLPEARLNQRRYGQIFHNPDVEAIGMPSPEESMPTTAATESTKALFPPLPPFRIRKRSCGGA